MQKFQQEYISPFSVEQIYQLITDVEDYPKFLPWCGGAKIIEKSDDMIIADLSINFTLFSEQYRSEITLLPPSNGKAEINVKTISGPFKHLTNSWKLEERNGKTIIKFNIEFEFKSVVLEKIIGIVFNKAQEQMMEAFMKRAEDLFGDSDV